MFLLSIFAFSICVNEANSKIYKFQGLGSIFKEYSHFQEGSSALEKTLQILALFKKLKDLHET